MILTLDTETTGFLSKSLPLSHPEQPRIVQLCAILDDPSGQEKMRLDLIIQHDLESLSPELIENWRKAEEKAHGISPEFADKIGVTEEFAMLLLLDFLAVAETVVGHNIKGYDADIIRATIYRLFGDEHADPFSKATRIFDTMVASTPLCKLPGKNGYKSPKLSELHKFLFREDFDGAHQAINDVLATRRCYYKLIEIARSGAAEAA